MHINHYPVNNVSFYLVWTNGNRGGDENAGQSKMHGWKMQHQTAEMVNAGKNMH